MRIKSVTLQRLAAEASDARERWRVEIQSDVAGLVGVATADASSVWAIPQLTECFLIGEDPRATTLLWHRMSASGQDYVTAAAALDIALWDLKSKAQDEPLWKALGGSRPRVNAHARLPSATTAAATIARCGFRGAVLAHTQIEHLASVRDALCAQCSDPALMLDVHEAWSPKHAIRTLRRLESQFDLTWVEAPARQWDFLGLKRVSSAIRAAVCAGRRFSTTDFLALLHHRALDVVQIDIEHTGITGALQIADAAYGFELPVTLCATAGNLGVHLGAVVPTCMSVEIVDPCDGDVHVENGWAAAGDQAGNGIDAPSPRATA